MKVYSDVDFYTTVKSEITGKQQKLPKTAKINLLKTKKILNIEL